MSDRTPAQRMQDDEDARLAMCGLTPDERDEHEREDFESRHYDFIFTRYTRVNGDGSGLESPPSVAPIFAPSAVGVVGANGGGPSCPGSSPIFDLRVGHPEPAPPWREAGRTSSDAAYVSGRVGGRTPGPEAADPATPFPVADGSAATQR